MSKQEKVLPSVFLKVEGLPSKGLPYPKDATISYRSYSFGELKYASTSKLSIKETLELVLKGVKTNFPKKDLTMYDTLYIGILRKIASLGTPKIQFPYEIPNCKEIKYHIFELKDLEFDELEVPALPVRAELSDGNKYHFNPLTVGQYVKLSVKNQLKDNIAILASMCVNQPYEDTYAMLSNTTDADDMRDIEDIERMLEHGLKPIEIGYEAKSSNGEIINRKLSIKLEGRQALLMPFRDERASIRSRIQFGPES